MTSVQAPEGLERLFVNVDSKTKHANEGRSVHREDDTARSGKWGDSVRFPPGPGHKRVSLGCPHVHRPGAPAGTRTQRPETSQPCWESTNGGGTTRWGWPTAPLPSAGSRVCKTSLHAVLNGTHASRGAKAGVLTVAKGSRFQGDGAATQCVAREGRGPCP